MKMMYRNTVLWDEATEPTKPDEDEVVRRVRNAKLNESDWTQAADAPVNAAAWATYRKLLRDVPQQEGFPENITWPEPPA